MINKDSFKKQTTECSENPKCDAKQEINEEIKVTAIEEKDDLNNGNANIYNAIDKSTSIENCDLTFDNYQI